MMKAAFTLWLLICLAGITARAAEPSPALDLPATRIFSKGPNVYAGEVLEITKGRGAIIGWYVQAKQSEEVRVSIEYACAKPLNQAYQLSFDGHDRFWDVSPTTGGGWSQAELGVFQIRAGLPLLVLLVPPSGTKYDHPLRLRKLVLKGTNAGQSLAR